MRAYGAFSAGKAHRTHMGPKRVFYMGPIWATHKGLMWGLQRGFMLDPYG